MYEDVLRRSRRLPQWGVLAVTGADASTFLQGQVSTDLRAIEPDRVLLTSINSPQGRVQDVVWIAPRGESLLLITRSERLDATSARLKKYVLRSKVRIDVTEFTVGGVMIHADHGTWSAPLRQTQLDSANVIEWPGGRQLIVGTTHLDEDLAFTQTWDLKDINAGIPTICAETHESFVAQMLNLDLLGGISFEKGCYTGQEIIARTHFRGSVKRRMFRFQANCPPPPPGSRLLTDGSPAGEVVNSVASPNGCEFLAVMQLAQMDTTPTLEAQSNAIVQRLTVDG